MKKGKVGAIILAVALILGLVCCVTCLERVPAGYVGVVYNMSGGVDGEVLTQGWHLVSPTKKVTTYSIGLEQSYLTSADKGDSPNDESFSIPTSDGKTVQVDLEFSYRFDETRVSETFVTFKGKSGETIKDTFIKPKVVAWTQEVSANYPVTDNAAFAHDLRTPLTVLKGYNEMLQTSECKQTREIAATMGKHLSRMEAYVSSMSNLRRLEDTQPEYETISLQPFLSSLQESAQIVCTQNGKTLYLQNETIACEICIDRSFITQVCNNLLSNAVRYALTSITLSYYNIFTVQGTAASRVFFRIVAKAVRMGRYWPDVVLQGLTRPQKSLSASLSFTAFDLCR